MHRESDKRSGDPFHTRDKGCETNSRARAAFACNRRSEQHSFRAATSIGINRLVKADLPEFLIRFATVEDAAVIGWHRARMFQDMGLVPDELFESFRTQALDRIGRALASGEYFGWLVSLSAAPQKVIAGAGVILSEVPPFPRRQKNGEITIAEARRGLIVNVFTEPEWRRRGIAKLLMEQIISWSRSQNLDDLVLHASEHARALYEQLGFTLTEEMRLAI